MFVPDPPHTGKAVPVILMGVGGRGGVLCCEEEGGRVLYIIRAQSITGMVNRRGRGKEGLTEALQHVSPRAVFAT